MCIIAPRYCFELEQKAEDLVMVLSVFSFVWFTPGALASIQNYEGCYCSGCHLNCSNVGNLRFHMLSGFLHDHFPQNITPVMVYFLNPIPTM